MKKVRVYFWINTRQKKRLEDLSRKTRVLLSVYLNEAIEDILERHEAPNLRLVHEDTGKAAGTSVNETGLEQADPVGGG